MKRLHLFEFMDLPWFPDAFRRIQTDYLQFVVTRGAGHENLVPLIVKAMKQSGTGRIVDLCSGGTGPWLNLSQQLADAGVDVQVTLTDKHPHPASVERWAACQDGCIEYFDEPVDATGVPEHLDGMRTVFEGFHHFAPAGARAVLQDAVDQGEAIGVFDASLAGPLGLLFLVLSPLLTVLGYFFVTPFIKPRTVARFLWTYLVPIVPLTTSWDGIASFLRVYSPDELMDLVRDLDADGYVWNVGVAETGTPMMDFTYLVGYPK